MKRLYFSIILGIAPVFGLSPVLGAQEASAEHNHADGTPCTADHGHDEHQHKEGKPARTTTATRNIFIRTAPSAPATTAMKATSMRKGRPAQTTMATRSIFIGRRRLPATTTMKATSMRKGRPAQTTPITITASSQQEEPASWRI